MTEYNASEIAAAVRRNGLLALEFLLGGDCRVPHGRNALWDDWPHTPVLTPAQMLEVARQAQSLGARKVCGWGANSANPAIAVLGRGIAELGLRWRACPDPAEAGALCNLRQDDAFYGAGSRCRRIMYSCAVTACGCVLPCIGLPVPVGNVRTRALADILRDSEVFDHIRNYAVHVGEPCAACPEAVACYGCRGLAYRDTGDYLGSDARCPRNRNSAQAVARLPRPAAAYLPQQAPMRLVDTLLRIGERAAVVSAVFPPDSPFAAPDGLVDEAAYLEMMAQAIAALNGFRLRRRAGDDVRGFLLGCKQVVIRGVARVGDALEVRVYKDARYGEFSLIKGQVLRGQEVLAEGEIKVWQASSAGAAPGGKATP
jgi:radical SAM protein with 4Fe4S-binding SPASM domain